MRSTQLKDSWNLGRQSAKSGQLLVLEIIWGPSTRNQHWFQVTSLARSLGQEFEAREQMKVLH